MEICYKEYNYVRKKFIAICRMDKGLWYFFKEDKDIYYSKIKVNKTKTIYGSITNVGLENIFHVENKEKINSKLINKILLGNNKKTKNGIYLGENIKKTIEFIHKNEK